jgi:hypothetical protein
MIGALYALALLGLLVYILWPDHPEPQTWPTAPTKPLTARDCDIVGCTERARHFFAPVAVHRDTLLAVCDEHAGATLLWVGKFAELPEWLGGDSATTEPVTEGLPDGRSSGV